MVGGELHGFMVFGHRGRVFVTLRILLRELGGLRKKVRGGFPDDKQYQMWSEFVHTDLKSSHSWFFKWKGKDAEIWIMKFDRI